MKFINKLGFYLLLLPIYIVTVLEPIINKPDLALGWKEFIVICILFVAPYLIIWE